MKITKVEDLSNDAVDMIRISFDDDTNFEFTPKQVQSQIEKANHPDTQKALLVALWSEHGEEVIDKKIVFGLGKK